MIYTINEIVCDICKKERKQARMSSQGLREAVGELGWEWPSVPGNGNFHQDVCPSCMKIFRATEKWGETVHA